MIRNKQDARHIERAIAIARTSTCNRRHGVVIAHGPRVLAVAVNTNRNHPDVCSYPAQQAARHAEWNALRQIRGMDASRLTLYSARVFRSGEPALAKPCPACQSSLDLVGMGRVVWTT